MPPTLFAANATAISIEIGTAAAWLLGIIAAIVGIIGWLLKRELARAQVVEADVKQLLAGNVPWVKGMSLEIANLRLALSGARDAPPARDGRRAGEAARGA